MSKFKNIQEVCAHHIKVTVDKKLYKKINNFRLSWAMKSDEYIEFLGSNLLGVNIVRFSKLDEEALMVDILNVDSKAFQSDIKSLPEIDPNWKRVNVPVYMALIYLMHVTANTKVQGFKQEDMIKELYLIFSYRAFSSLIYNGFPFPANKNLAISTYEKLSRKFLIKRFNNWQEVFEYRATDVTNLKSIQYKLVKEFSTLDAINLIQVLQDKLKKNFLNVYSVMINTRNSGDIIKTTSLIETTEDGEGLKDLIERPDKYIAYLKSIIGIRDDFIRDDIVNIVAHVVTTLKEKQFKQLLLSISDNSEIIKPIIDKAIITTIEYLNNKKNLNTSDTIACITAIRNYWGYSKTLDKSTLEVKKELNTYINKYLKIKTKWVVSSLIIALILYIYLRATIK